MLDRAENPCNAQSHGSTSCNIKPHFKAKNQCGNLHLYLNTALY